MVLVHVVCFLFVITLSQVKEVTVDYTECKNQDGKRCSEEIQYNGAECNCTIPFELQQDFKVGWLCLCT